MTRRELIRAINRDFKRYGKEHSWIHESFNSHVEKNTLAHFRITDIAWFKGASEILEKVDRLHTLMTSRKEFAALAEYMGFIVDDQMSKRALVQLVKSQKAWRLWYFEYDKEKRKKQQEEKLVPFYNYLNDKGYEPLTSPKQAENSLRLFYIKVRSYDTDKEESFFINENPDGTAALIQRKNGAYVGTWYYETDTADTLKMPF